MPLGLLRRSERLYPDIAKPNFRPFGFEEYSSTGERDHVRGIFRIRLFKVAGAVHDTAIYQMGGPISTDDHFDSVPAIPIFEVSALQNATGVAGSAADAGAGLHIVIEHRHGRRNEKRGD